MNTEELNKLKIALMQIDKGEPVKQAVTNAEYVNYDQQLLDKINILKNITILNKDVIKYLYSINLTDKIADVAPKVNAIYQLALSAKLIEDTALKIEQEKRNNEANNSLLGSTEAKTAANVLNAILNINK